MDQYKAERLIKSMEECLRPEEGKESVSADEITAVLTDEQKVTADQFLRLFNRGTQTKRRAIKTPKK